jgi:PAT family beta-lactamase induction signal transducer AmpG
MPAFQTILEGFTPPFKTFHFLFSQHEGTRRRSMKITNQTRQWPTPWVFSLLILPLGIVVGFKATPLPFLLAKAGVPVDRISSISSMVNLTGVLLFLWAPLADINLRRRTWAALGILGTAFFVCAYFPLIGAAHLKLMTTLILLGGIAEALILAGCGGLMVRTLSSVSQARASAWWQAGWLGGGALGGAAIMWLAARMPLLLVGVCTATLIALLGFLPFTISEAKPNPSPWFRGRLIQIGREIWDVLRMPDRRWSVVLLLSPGGTGAAMFLLPAIASHYGVGQAGVLWTNGVGGGILMALGAACGTLVPGDWDRRLMYAVAGVLNAFAALVLLMANRPSVYLVGTALYLVTNGFCAAWFTALMAEVVGEKTRDASTLFSILNSIGSLPVIYMIWLEGVGFHHFGTHGLLWVDAAGSLLVGAVVVAVYLTCGLSLRRVPVSQHMPGSCSEVANY